MNIHYSQLTNKKAKLFHFFKVYVKDIQNIPLLMDALSRIMRSSPQKSEGANSKKSMNYS